MGHPCFDKESSGGCGRAHLPVAPKCNLQCNYCDRRFDCANESRPGVASALLKPFQAAAYFDDLKARDPSLTVAGIAGPGDPLANADATLETFRLIHDRHPDVHLCVSTNGLALPQHVDALAEVGVRHLTVTVNAVDPEVGRWMYAWAREGTTLKRGLDAAAWLWERQRAGIAAAAKHGMAIKINSILVPGINETHLADVAGTVRNLGATIMNIIPLIPVAGTEFSDLPEPTHAALLHARALAAPYLPIMAHCARCRADAVGKLGADDPTAQDLLRDHANRGRDGNQRKFVAVASMEGLLVNQHLGEADELLIYARDDNGSFRQVGIRTTPPAGNGSARWQDLGELLNDCRAVLVSGVGPSPLRTLEGSGLRVLEVDGAIDDLLPVAWTGGDLRRFKKPTAGCDTGGCKGAGLGCA